MRVARTLSTIASIFLFVQTGWAEIDTVRMQDFTFVPSSLTIHAGDTVVWKSVQQCCVPHTSTRSTAPMTWNSGFVVLNGTFRLAFPSTGTFSYFCANHSDLGMVGSVTVLPLPPPPPIPAMNWLGLLFLGANLTAAGIWILERKRKTA